MKTQKKANLPWRSRRLASRKPVRLLLQIIFAPGNWMRTLSAFLPALCTCTQKEPFLRRTLIPANSSYGKGCLPKAITKLVTRLMRRNDQEERQSDAAVHWDTTRPKKRSKKQGAQDSSEEDWLRYFHRRSSKKRFEYCEDSKKTWLTSEQFEDTLVE